MASLVVATFPNRPRNIAWWDDQIVHTDHGDIEARNLSNGCKVERCCYDMFAVVEGSDDGSLMVAPHKRRA
jgi:hypothetical protein